jgi:hypothetical protein
LVRDDQNGRQISSKYGSARSWRVIERMIAEDPDLYQLTEVELAELDLGQKRDSHSNPEG